jgi:protein-tyrosine phosphatase
MTETLHGAIALPSGALVRGRGLRKPLPAGPVPDYGLYLGSKRFRRRQAESLRWEHQWIEWPDFWLPADRDHAGQAIEDLHRRLLDGERAEVACGGGIGRTGTVIACLAVLDGLDPGSALRWTREHHHPKAVETPGQRRWIEQFAEHRGH